MNFLATVPDGAKVRFPPNGVYGQSLTITIADRKDLEIDGNNSTFKKLVPTDPSRPNNANWRIVGGDGVTLENMIIKGSYDAPASGHSNTPRSRRRRHVRQSSYQARRFRQACQAPSRSGELTNRSWKEYKAACVLAAPPQLKALLVSTHFMISNLVCDVHTASRPRPRGR